MSTEEVSLALELERYRPWLLQRVMRMVKCSADAEDVVQEAIVRAYVSLHHFRQGSELRTWLYQIARNHVIDRVRRGKYLADDPPAYELLLDFAISEDRECDPVAMAELGELRRRLCAAMAMLPARQREMIKMRYFRGLTQAETASALNCPIGTVKSNLARALAAMRRRLKES